MEREPRSTPLITITCCLILIPLSYAAFLAAYRTPYQQWTPWFSNSTVNGGQNSDSLKFLLERLGTDVREKLESSGFACDVAPMSVVCVANQQVKIETKNLKVHVSSFNNNQTDPQIETLVQPYPMQEVKGLMKWITPVHILVEKSTTILEAVNCNYTNDVPVVQVVPYGLVQCYGWCTWCWTHKWDFFTSRGCGCSGCALWTDMDVYFGKPTKGMGLKYLEYKIEVDESSLIRSYGPNDTVIADPDSIIFSRGYEAARAIFVDGQNMSIDHSRFRATRVEALLHLGHPSLPTQ